LIKKVNILVFVYNIPPRVGYGITPSLLKRIAYERTCGIKDAGGDIILFYQFIMTIRNLDFKFLVGTERLMLLRMIASRHGCVAGLSSAFPEVIVEFYKMLKEECYKEAVERQFFIIELTEGYNVFGAKHTGNICCLEAKGVDVRHPKPPYKSLSDEELERLKSRLSEKNLF
jgi:N-acetylneuraminate lyase/4-hydroxy-tetrahydrodipicolinate synthase